MENQLDERSSLESILEYGQLLWHWAWLLLLAGLIAGGVAYFLTNRQPRIYESSTRVIVSASTSSSYDMYYASIIGQTLAETYSATMTSNLILDAVAERLGYPITGKVVVTQVVPKPLIDIKVSETDPYKAAEIANTLVEVFAEKVVTDQANKFSGLKSSLENQIAEIDKELININDRLAILSIKFSEIESNERKIAAMEAIGVRPTITAEKDPADIVEQTQLQFAQSQYQNTRFSLFSNLQQLKLSEAQSTTSISQIYPAIPNPIPIEPKPLQSSLLAAVIGLIVAAGVIFIFAFFDDSIHDPDEITRKWGVPVLGVISNYNSHQNEIIASSQPRSPVSEAFRSLRTNLQFSGVNKPLNSILITSASPSDGKTSIVANLATVLAQSDRDVVVVDCDLRRPRLHKIFEVTNRIGLSDYFIRVKDQLDGMIKKTSSSNVCVITSGSLPPNPSELLSSSKMSEVINLLGKHYDLVVLDTPPLLVVTDALVLASRVDGVILVMDPKKTNRTAARHAIEQVQRINANLLGVVLNNVNIKKSRYYSNRDYYYHEEKQKKNNSKDK